MVRRLGEENVDSGADVALFPFEYSRSRGRRIAIQHKDQVTGRKRKSHPHKNCETCWNFLAWPWRARSSSQRECDLWSQGEWAHTLLWKVDGTWLGNQQQRAHVGEWWLEGTTQLAKSFVTVQGIRVIRASAWSFGERIRLEIQWTWTASWKLIDFKICGSHNHSGSGRITRADESYLGEKRR